MKIAIVKLSALGDIVHAMVVLQFIKKYNQKIEIDWIVEESYKELLELNPDVSNVHVINIKKAKTKKSFFLLFKELKKVQKFGPYDLVIDMQGIFKSALVSRLIPSRNTLGFDRSSIRERISSIFYTKTFKYAYDQNIIERNFELTKFALVLPFRFQEIRHKLPFLFSRKKYLNPYLSNIKKNIVLVLGASLLSKRYPVEKFAELTNLLEANYLVIWGSNEEKLLANEIKKLAPHINICEKLSIEALISLFSQVDLIIGPDTGPTHMAWGLNIPSITLFGPTPGYRNSFISLDNAIIESKSKVNPYKIKKNDLTISNIEVSEIVKIAKKILN